MTFAKGRNPAAIGAVVVAMLLLPGAARAQAKVDVQADTVLVSNKDATIDPPELVKLKENFLKNGLAFTSFKRLKSARLSLEQGKPARVDLPNKKAVTLRLESVKDGTARVQVDVPPVSQTLTLGREGSVSTVAGEHEGGKLVFVLSPASAAKPRRSAPLSSRPQALVCPREP